MNIRIPTLCLVTLLLGSASFAQTNATIVIRHEPALMTLTSESLSSLLDSPERRRALREGIAGLEGKEMSVMVFTSDTPQPEGVFVGTLHFEIAGEIDDKTNALILERLADTLSNELRDRLEKAPLARLEQQREELRAQLDDIARRRRGESASEEIESRRRVLTVQAEQSRNDLDNAERMLAETDTTRAYLAAELARLQEQFTKTSDPTVVQEKIARVSAEIAQVTSQVQQLHRQVGESKVVVAEINRTLADLQKRQSQLASEREDQSLLAAAFDRVAGALARVEARIVDFRRFEFEIWR